MGQCIIARRGGTVETEPYLFASIIDGGRTGPSVFSASYANNVFTDGSGEKTIAIPNYRASQAVIVIGNTRNIPMTQGETTHTVKVGESFKNTYRWFQYGEADGDGNRSITTVILGTVEVTVAFDGYCVKSTSKLTRTSVVPPSVGYTNYQQANIEMSGLNAYFDKVK